MTTVEWWVMRVLGPDTMELSARQREELIAGGLACVNGEICEPVECYADQERANAEALRAHRRTNAVHKVVMSANFEP